MVDKIGTDAARAAIADAPNDLLRLDGKALLNALDAHVRTENQIERECGVHQGKRQIADLIALAAARIRELEAIVSDATGPVAAWMSYYAHAYNLHDKPHPTHKALLDRMMAAVEVAQRAGSEAAVAHEPSHD